MKITHNDKTEQFNIYTFWDSWEARPEHRQYWGEMVREGLITDDDDVPLTGRVLQRVRDRLLGTYDDMPSPGGLPFDQNQRWLVPGLWRWGTIPMLGGNPKAGKTTILADLVAALLVPDYRFLDHFEPVPTDTNRSEAFFTVAQYEDEHTGGVWLINAETPPSDLIAALELGLGTRGRWSEPDPEHRGIRRRVVRPTRFWDALTVEHLEDLGGAHWFDLTDPEIYEVWAHRLASCDDCEGADDWVPTTVIVDGLTAILHAAGKGTEAYGQWYAAFRRLLNECDIPNGLVAAHNIMSGGHLMGGTEAQAGADGLWTYSSDNPDNASSKRWFSVRPRMGGVAIAPTAVALNEGGRPMVQGSPQGHGPAITATDSVEVVAERTAEYVREHPGAGGQELTDNVDSDGSKEMNLRGRERAVEKGWIREEPCASDCSLCERPHHRRRHFWPVTPV